MLWYSTITEASPLWVILVCGYIALLMLWLAGRET